MCRIRAFAALLTCFAIGNVNAALAADKNEPKPSAADLFGFDKLWQFHIEMSAKEYDAMQPANGGMMFPGFPGQPPKQPEKKADPMRDSHRSVFGVDFPWVRASFSAEGKTFENIGLRYKGNSTYMATARSLKRSLKVDLDRFDDKQRYHGFKELNLHAGVMDPSKGREALAYSVFRSAGVPAPRTAFAEVTLSVPGKYNKELMGLYIVVEPVDKGFLKDHFGNPKGVLMKPERIRSLDYLGEDWERYKTTYQPKSEPNKEQIRRIIDFAKLVNRASDDQFEKEIASYLDVDAFLRFLAANALAVNLDSFFTLGHNYYLYLHPETNRFAFIPWDVDLSLANFAMFGTAEQQMDLSLRSPYPTGSSRLTDRLMNMKNVRESYERVLKETAAKSLVKDKLLVDIATIERTVKEPLARESKVVAGRKEGPAVFGFAPGGGLFGRPPELRTFVEKRIESVEAQLAGKSKGYVPAMGFNFGPPAGGQGAVLAAEIVKRADKDKNGKLSRDELQAAVELLLKEADRNKDDQVDEKELADTINRIAPMPKFGPPGGGPPGGNPEFIPKNPRPRESKP